MRAVEINIYKFDELSDDIKEKVVNRFRENNDFPFLKDDLEEELNRLLKENNIDTIRNYDFYYSLSYSQGDGFCFVGQFMFKKYRVIITHIGHYYHYKSVNIEYEFVEDEEDNITISDDEYKAVDIEFKSVYKEICNKVEKYGYGIIEDENSEEHIKEEIEANGYEFFGKGDIYNGEGKEINNGDYETKVVDSWIGSEDITQNFWLNIARNYYINISKMNREASINHLADSIKKSNEEESPITTGVYADLLNSAISKINWHKIAEHLIDIVKEECDKSLERKEEQKTRSQTL